MKRNLLLSTSLMALAACSQSATTPQASATVGSATPAPAPEATPCIQAGYQILPAGVRLDIAYHLRADRLHTGPDGKLRRRIVLEYLDGDLDATLQSVGKSLTDAGFIARPRKGQPNGNIVDSFVKKGFGMMLVAGNPSPGNNPSDPAAKGTVALDYPLTNPASANTTPN